VTLGDYLAGVGRGQDGASKPALIVQGGGLRGIYSMSALATLEELGLRDSFSFVIGSSAGAINGAYFLAGQAREGVGIYVDDLSNRHFISPLRFWKIVDVDYMVDVALKQRHPLDIDAMLAAPAPLYTVLTDAETAQAAVVSNRDPEIDIYEAFRATGALPVLYNRRVLVGDRRYIDGGIAEQVPLAEAIRRGASEALVILTRGAGHRRVDRSPVYRAGARLLSFGQSRAIRAKVGVVDEVYNAAMETLEAKNGTHTSCTTWSLWPSDLQQLVGRTTKDVAALRACAELARTDMMALLSGEHENVASC
jgi:predicted patatin/cPLA2 family phospholipase